MYTYSLSLSYRAIIAACLAAINATVNAQNHSDPLPTTMEPSLTMCVSVISSTFAKDGLEICDPQDFPNVLLGSDPFSDRSCGKVITFSLSLVVVFLVITVAYMKFYNTNILNMIF